MKVFLNKVKNNNGSVLIYLIILTAVLSLFGTAVLKMQETSTIGIAQPNCAKQARYMAESGVRYAMQEIRSGTDYNSLENINYIPESGSPNDFFSLSINKSGSNYYVSSTGSSCSASNPVTHNISDYHFIYTAPGGGGPSDYVAIGKGKIEIDKKSEVTGDISSENEVKIKEKGKVTGNIESGKKIKVEKKSEVIGDITADEKVEIKKKVKITGDIHSGKEIKIDEKVVIEGDIFSKEKIEIKEKSQITGNINAGGEVKIKKKVVITGNICSEGDVTLEEDSVVNGNVSAHGKITLGKKAKINGDATAGDSISLEKNAEIIGTTNQYAGEDDLCEVIEPDQYEAPPDPAETDFSIYSYGADVKIANNGSKNLAPGEYKELKIGEKAELTLSSGTYYFKKIDAKEKLDLKIDLSSGDRINIFVEKDVKFKKNLNVYIKDSSGGYKTINDADQNLASLIYSETHKDWKLDDKSEWMGTIYAKEKLEIKEKNTFIGSFYFGKDLSLDDSIDFTYVESAYASENW